MHGLAVIQLYVCNPDLYNQNCITDRTHAIKGDLRICYFHILLLQSSLLCVLIGHLQGILPELSTGFLAGPFLFCLLPSSFHASILTGLGRGNNRVEEKANVTWNFLALHIHCSGCEREIWEKWAELRCNSNDVSAVLENLARRRAVHSLLRRKAIPIQMSWKIMPEKKFSW